MSIDFLLYFYFTYLLTFTLLKILTYLILLLTYLIFTCFFLLFFRLLSILSCSYHDQRKLSATQVWNSCIVPRSLKDNLGSKRGKNGRKDHYRLIPHAKKTKLSSPPQIAWEENINMILKVRVPAKYWSLFPCLRWKNQHGWAGPVGKLGIWLWLVLWRACSSSWSECSRKSPKSMVARWPHAA